MATTTTTRTILYLCKNDCGNVAEHDEVTMAKKIWSRMYDNLRRKPDEPYTFGDYVVTALTMVDKKMQIRVQSDLECQTCKHPIDTADTDAFPSRQRKTSGIEFTEVCNKTSGTIYKCARCGKDVKQWLWILQGLIFGYRCARKVGRDLKREDMTADQIFPEYGETEDEQDTIGVLVYTTNLGETITLRDLTPEQIAELESMQADGVIRITSRVKNYRSFQILDTTDSA